MLMRTLLVALVLLGLAVPLRDAAWRSRRVLPDQAELTLFPKGEWARPLALGHARLAADLCWLEAIQYYGRHRQTDRAYPQAEALFHTVTTLDPQMEEAYVFGALVLNGEGRKPEAAGRLLQEGIRRNPMSWRLRFEYGFLAFLRQKDDGEAIAYLTQASRLPGAPPQVARLAAYAAGKAGRTETAIALWREMLRSSDNEEVRRIARRYLQELGRPESEDGSGARDPRKG
jgi:tetratricopeptide (TPR) repeat protein